MARVRYLTREAAGAEQAALFDRLERERKVPTANVFMALANAPEILEGFLTYANALRASAIRPALRELAILVVSDVTACEYETAHHHSHAIKAGVSEAQYAAVPEFEASPLFSAEEKAVMAFAKESTLHVDVSDVVWNDAAEYLSERQLVELAIIVAWYNSGVRIMGALRIDLEDGYKA
jgi:AhpD family alkylhydroperoxidase